ncbi:MAG: hypothetical protein M1821_007748 [Bathelium mastoideum]|nr:MAG: hypothetical protein M1821_007748 [Bathelium mastoideum]
MFALFKSFGIPSISSLLCATGQFTQKSTVDKRYVDTGNLLLEAVLNPPGSQRSIHAIARINYLHNRHRRREKISDEDMLYTLSLFALEPMRWVERHEWRELTDVEKCALGKMWQVLGEALEVKYDLLAGSKNGWESGLEWLQDLDKWSLEYEKVNLVPAETNKKAADATIFLITWTLPSVLKNMSQSMVAVCLDDRLRAAMLLPDPPRQYFTAFQSFVSLRKFILRYLSFPRIKPKKRLAVPAEKSTDTNKRSASTRLQPRKYRIYPWYIVPSFSNRYGLSAWVKRFKGKTLPGDDGDKYFPQGFVASELGPTMLRGTGEEEMRSDRDRLCKLFEADNEPIKCEERPKEG